MLENMKNKRNILIVSILIFCFILFIIIGIINTLIDSNKNIKIDINKVDDYVVDQDVVDKNGSVLKESNLVKDYSTFYTLQDATENFIEYLINGKYSETYKILDLEMTKKYSKDEYLSKIDKYLKDKFVVNSEILQKKNSDMDPESYEFSNTNNLVKLYKVSDQDYICVTKDLYSDTFKLGVRINKNDKTYKIFYIEF